MLFNHKALIHWKELSNKKQKWVYKANLRENNNRVDYDHVVGQRIYIKNDGVQNEMNCSKQGPFKITEAFSNGTVHIQRDNVNEKVSIRIIEPHFWISPPQLGGGSHSWNGFTFKLEFPFKIRFKFG